MTRPRTLKEVHTRIEEWHENGEGPLHEALGWTWQEYARWVETGALPLVCGLCCGGVRIRVYAGGPLCERCR